VEGGKVAGAWVTGGEVGPAVVGFDPPVFAPAGVTGRLLGMVQAEKTRIETSNKEWNRILISLL
jgi:hypothetical protein